MNTYAHTERHVPASWGRRLTEGDTPNIHTHTTQEESHSGWDLHYCHTAVHTDVTAVTIATSVMSVVYLTVLWQQWPRQHYDRDGSNISVSAM